MPVPLRRDFIAQGACDGAEVLASFEPAEAFGMQKERK